jgi:hypothetical protein
MAANSQASFGLFLQKLSGNYEFKKKKKFFPKFEKILAKFDFEF